MQDGALMQRRPDRAVQSIFQVQRALVLHDVRKQVAEKCRILGKQGRQVEGAFRRHQVVEPDLAGCHFRPLPGRGVPVVRVGAPVADGLENHLDILRAASPTLLLGSDKAGHSEGPVSAVRQVTGP